MRVGLTLRTTEDRWKEPIDTISHHWWILLEAIFDQAEVSLLSSRAKCAQSTLALDALILTGGNSLGEDRIRDEFELDLLRHCVKSGLPVLGVCRGMQLIQTFFGGTLVPVDEHAGTRHWIEPAPECPEKLRPLFSREVNSFHRFSIAKTADSLRPLARDTAGNFEATIDREEKVLGLMWHPERLPLETEDIELIRHHFADD